MMAEVRVISKASLSWMEFTSWYMLKISRWSSERLSTMYWKVWVWIASSKAWRSMY